MHILRVPSPLGPGPQVLEQTHGYDYKAVQSSGDLIDLMGIYILSICIYLSYNIKLYIYITIYIYNYNI